jgi:hypothetical protein
MRDYLAYHNPDVMGYSAVEVSKPSIPTNKSAKCSMGDRVWLITGEGKPRRYYLRLYFTVTSVDNATNQAFETEITGADERFLDPMPCLDDYPWFGNLKTKMANFSLGFQPINHAEAVRGLEAVAGMQTASASGG